MKIAFVWTGLTSYMGDCWRTLAAQPGVALKVVIVQEAHNAKQVSFQADEVLRGLDAVVVDDGRPLDGGMTQGLVEWKPDVLFVVGWHAKACRSFVEDKAWDDIPKVCCFDMPWRWQLRCLVAPLVLRRFLSKYDAAYVPGVVCERYAKWLGFKKICKGLFGIDTKRFVHGPHVASESASPYFLYVGRNSGEKRLDVLRAAHRRYLERGGKIALRLCGKGLEDGFASPDDVPRLMRDAAAFVLPSDFDPWPLVLLEAMSAGCPVIASDRCTNRPELGRGWTVFRHGDVEELTEVLLRFDGKAARQGAKDGVSLAARYDCSEWTVRTLALAKEVCGGR